MPNNAELQRRAWNQASAAYQTLHALETDDITYGPLLPGEKQLHLLGNLKGQRVVDLGCGGGQNAIALCNAGAQVIGVDVSDAQIVFARQVAAIEDVAVEFVRGDVTDLSFLDDQSCDCILAVYVFPYVDNLPQALAECHRVLKPGGRLILSQDHPIRATFWDEESGAEGVLPVRSYFDHQPLRWSFADTGTAMISYHRPLQEWFIALQEAGFQVQALREFPLPPGTANAPWADEYTAEIAVHLPQTLVLVAQKREQVG